MTLDKYLVFDIETTGLDTAKDQIIEICIKLVIGDTFETKTRRIKPTIAISPGSTVVHGITDDDVKDCPTFNQLGKAIKQMFDEVDIIVGYNVSFDLQILQAELKRNNLELIDLNKKQVIDPLNIWRKMRPRKLVDAYKTFCNKELIDAHSAEADVLATDEILQAMLVDFDLQNATSQELASMSTQGDYLGLTHHFSWDKGIPVISFGKAKGEPIWEYFKENKGYLDWMKTKDFPEHVIEISECALKMMQEEFLSWAREFYPSREVVKE